MWMMKNIREESKFLFNTLGWLWMIMLIFVSSWRKTFVGFSKRSNHRHPSPKRRELESHHGDWICYETRVWVWNNRRCKTLWRGLNVKVTRCTIDGESGWKWGDRGEGFVGPDAKSRAIKSGLTYGNGCLALKKLQDHLLHGDGVSTDADNKNSRKWHTHQGSSCSSRSFRPFCKRNLQTVYGGKRWKTLLDRHEGLCYFSLYRVGTRYNGRPFQTTQDSIRLGF